ncbi:MAG: alpha-glucan family phosphorylase [Thermodesulfovibrionales bacterium]|nr:alpha-glucan family phosphorylase [Thermodesulfovibrionales bacterium]
MNNNHPSELAEFLKDPRIAYFSMEIGVHNDIHTYSGGLGVLAGDTIRSAADMKLPMAAVTLISKKGYFRQKLDNEGNQTESPADWEPSKFMTLLHERVHIRLEGRDVGIQAWFYIEKSITGGKIPMLFLDTDVEGNAKEDRELTYYLYGGDDRYRLKQEAVLGIGGVRMLYELGFEIKKYHMNEGHAGLLTVELLNEFKKDIEEVWDEDLIWDVPRVRDFCVFTTHTPVDAGHDRFSYELVLEVLGEILPIKILKKLGGEGKLNMTLLGLNLSEYINGVAKKHRDVSKSMFPGYEISSVTNGVHSYTWTCESMRRLYDKYIPGWANEPELFVRVGRIPDEEIWAAHMEAKGKLLGYVYEATGVKMDYDMLTIGFARRATAYKRAYLLFNDIERLKGFGAGKLQIVYAGKAHPKDNPGKDLIRHIYKCKEALKGVINIVYLEDYDMEIALKMVSGVDLWLNTPQRPREASGTSGMKAAHNGVMNFSVLDGWWIEGHIEGYTGWSIGPASEETATAEDKDAPDVEDLYHKLGDIIIPTFYNDRHTWVRMMQNAIGKNAYYFNSHRMMRRYVTEAYIR